MHKKQYQIKIHKNNLIKMICQKKDKFHHFNLIINNKMNTKNKKVLYNFIYLIIDEETN